MPAGAFRRGHLSVVTRDSSTSPSQLLQRRPAPLDRPEQAAAAAGSLGGSEGAPGAPRVRAGGGGSSRMGGMGWAQAPRVMLRSSHC